MAGIFDNFEPDLLAALRMTLATRPMPIHASAASTCAADRRAVDDLVQWWSVEAGRVCRALVGMPRPPNENIREPYRAAAGDESMDSTTAKCAG
jgi:hypothetical protein